MEFKFSESAKKDVTKLPKIQQSRLKKKLILWQNLPDPFVHAKSLTKHEASHRFRFGSYRVLVKLVGQDMRILRVRHRKDAYKR